MSECLSPEEIVKTITAELGSAVLSSKIQMRCEGVKKKENRNIWITIDKSAVHDAADALMKISYPHLSCIAGYDKGAKDENLRIHYIFSIYGGIEDGETMVTFSLDLPKSNPVLPTITDLMGGTAFTEREKTEYLGIQIEGLEPAAHRFFLPEDFPNDVYPLRKDEKKIPDSMVKNLWECGRPQNRPPAPLSEKPAEPKPAEDNKPETKPKEGA